MPAPDDARPDSSRERQLELALARQAQVLAEYAASLRAIQQSRAWRLLWVYTRLRDKLLPPWTARRRGFERIVRLCFDALENWFRRSGKGPPPPADLLGGPDADYPAWCRRHDASAADLLRQRLQPPAPAPVVAIVPIEPPLPAGPGRSLAAQTYARWEFCSAGTTIPTSAAWVAYLGAGVELAPSALYEVVANLNADPDADLLYTDHDLLDAAGGRHAPHAKPDWSPEFLRANPFVGPFLVARRSLAEAVGGPRAEAGTAVLADLALRLGERARKVRHLPRILAHVHPAPPPTADDLCRVVTEHLGRVGEPAAVSPGPLPGTCRLVYPLPHRPTVSVIIPNRDSAELLDRCVGSVLAANWPGLEVTVVENGSTDPETHALYRRLRERGVRVVEWAGPFNYSAVNNLAARDAHGELLLFLNNDVEAPEGDDWLGHLARHALRPDVGAVGAKLLFADDTVQHAGVVLGLFGVAGHSHYRFPRSAPGHLGQLRLAREVSAVTGACLMVRRRAFEEAGGFDESFAVAYNDVDLCLRLRERGLRTLWTPEAELYHLESVTRGSDETPEKRRRLSREVELFTARWRRLLEAGDPFYSPLLRVDGTDHGLRR
jgi:GT2 family glycosyltransferase